MSVPPDIRPALQVTDDAQRLREDLIQDAAEGEEVKIKFSGAKARQAFALAQSLDESLHKRNMMLIFNPIKDEGGYYVYLVQKQEHVVDTTRAMVNEKERNRLLKDWYDGLYSAVQDDDGRIAASIFLEMMDPMGINPYEEQGELDIFFVFKDQENHPVHRHIGNVKDIAQGIGNNELQVPGVEEDIISKDSAFSLLNSIYEIIDAISHEGVGDLFSPEMARQIPTPWV